MSFNAYVMLVTVLYKIKKTRCTIDFYSGFENDAHEDRNVIFVNNL